MLTTKPHRLRLAPKILTIFDSRNVSDATLVAAAVAAFPLQRKPDALIPTTELGVVEHYHLDKFEWYVIYPGIKGTIGELGIDGDESDPTEYPYRIAIVADKGMSMSDVIAEFCEI